MNRLLIPVAAIAIGFAAPAGAQTVSSIDQDAEAHVAGLPPSTRTYTYLIGPLDSLNVVVFDVPQLTQTVQVDSSGYIDFPLIGHVQASGRTPNQLADAIATALKAKYMKNPIVTVSMKDAVSQRVTVEGAVTQPGMYQIGPNTTLTQAVALAHGPSDVADTSEIAVYRTGPEGRAVKTYDLDDLRDGKITDPVVRPGDEIEVGTSGSRKFVRDFGNVFPLFDLFRY
jgi:polysaccharide export outer membrane protein